jgi:hypothetical protein
MPPTAAELSTDPRSWQHGIWWRRGFLALLTVLVVAAFFGVFGVKSRTVSARSRSGAVTLQVHYAQVARAGLDVPFQIEVRRSGGFDRDVVLQVSSSYLDLFDSNGIDPEPDHQTSTASSVLWRFHRPPTDTLTVTVDMQVQKGRHWGRAGSVAVLDPDGHQLARTTFKTWLSP